MGWLELALKEIGPITSVAMGLVTLVQKMATEIKSSDDPAAKASTVLGDVANEAGTVRDALLKNTQHE